MSHLSKLHTARAALAGSLFLPAAVMAQTTIATTAVEDFLENQVIVGIGAIGAVMLLVAVVFAGYRWVRGAAGGN